MHLKPVWRVDHDAKMLRMFRILWTRGKVGDGRGYSAKLSFALSPTIFKIEREWREVSVCILGLRIHFKRSFGGVMV